MKKFTPPLCLSLIHILKDFQNQVESLHAGDKIKVAVLRNGKDEYTEIEFSVTVGAR